MMQTLLIPCGGEPTMLTGSFHGCAEAGRLILLATVGSGNHLNPRHRFLARNLSGAHTRVLLFDLLSAPEAAENRRNGRFPNDTGSLAARIAAIAHWVTHRKESSQTTLGLLGLGDAGSASLVAASALTVAIRAVVISGTSLDVPRASLTHLQASTLLITSERNDSHRRANERAFALLTCEKDLRLIEDAEALIGGDALEKVSEYAAAWFEHYLEGPCPAPNFRRSLALAPSL